ncbi:MAG TPA: hypothetical protein VFQ00_13760 [Terriglobales bacterium]|nr:hypothetical protein [Terriglobales bacterium]
MKLFFCARAPACHGWLRYLDSKELQFFFRMTLEPNACGDWVLHSQEFAKYRIARVSLSGGEHGQSEKEQAKKACSHFLSWGQAPFRLFCRMINAKVLAARLPSQKFAR